MTVSHIQFYPILADLGSTDNIMNPSFVQKLRLQVSSLDTPIKVVFANENSTLIHQATTAAITIGFYAARLTFLIFPIGNQIIQQILSNLKARGNYTTFLL